MTQSSAYDSLVQSTIRRIADLSEESLLQLSQYISFLKWQEEQWREWDEEDVPGVEPADADSSHRDATREDVPAPLSRAGDRRSWWVYDFIEHFEGATATGTKTSAGMEVKVAPAMCGLEQRLAVWQHPPSAGASVLQFQFTVPPNVDRLRFQAKVGIRNGSLIAESLGNYVAFRLLVNGVRLWGTTKNSTTWEDVAVSLPTLSGEYVTVQLVTDGLGDSRWNWAVWGTPLLVGE